MLHSPPLPVVRPELPSLLPAPNTVSFYRSPSTRARLRSSSDPSRPDARVVSRAYSTTPQQSCTTEQFNSPPSTLTADVSRPRKSPLLRVSTLQQNSSAIIKDDYASMLTRSLWRCERIRGLSLYAHLVAANEISASQLDQHWRIQEKLKRFFGEVPIMDVSISSILSQRVRALVHAKIPLAYFLRFLLDEYCAENLFCYLEIINFERHDFTSLNFQKRAANQIVAVFLESSSLLEVNISHQQRKAAADIIARCNDAKKLSTVFVPIRKALLTLMESIYRRFEESSWFKQMCNDLNGECSVFGALQSKVAADMLKSWLPSGNEPDSHGLNDNGDGGISYFPGDINSSEIMQTSDYYIIVSELVKEFCSKILALDTTTVDGTGAGIPHSQSEVTLTPSTRSTTKSGSPLRKVQSAIDTKALFGKMARKKSAVV